MKRFRRIAFNFLASVSALLCVATMTLWVRSHYARDTYRKCQRYDNTFVDRMISYGGGEFAFFWSRIQYGRGPWPASWPPPDAFWDVVQRTLGWHSNYPDLPIIFERLGVSGPAVWWFHSFHRVTPVAGTSFVHSEGVFIVPFWIPFIVTAALPAWKLRASIRQLRLNRRRRAGFCGSCGYDLRATLDRCPECGNKIERF